MEIKIKNDKVFASMLFQDEEISKITNKEINIAVDKVIEDKVKLENVDVFELIRNKSSKDLIIEIDESKYLKVKEKIENFFNCSNIAEDLLFMIIYSASKDID